MKIGGTVSAWSAGAAGLSCAAATLSLSLFGVVEGGRLTDALIAGLIAAAAGGGLGLPLGLVLERDVHRLRSRLGAIEESEQFEPITTRAWLRPLASAVHDTVASISDRLDEARTRVREMEVRQRVIEAERDHLEAVLHSLQDAVLVTDSFNELTVANAPAAELLGFDLQGSQRRSIDEVVTDEKLRDLIRQTRDASNAGHRKRVEHALPTGSVEAESEAQNNGHKPEACYDVTLACLSDSQQKVDGVVTILRDITREREISQMKSEFVSKASHELRTPLSSINAYIEMLLDGDAEDEESRQEFYQVIKNEADRLGRLIDNMLNISRIEAGIIKINFTEVDFVKAAHEAVEVIRPQASLKDIRVTVQSGPLAYTATADKDMIHQVMLNLLSNAVKYTPEGGRVTVNIENDDATSSVMVTVSDTGLGIPPDALPKLFDKFYRIENYKRVAKGTGLGLNLVKHIVETVHHGHVSVSSELGMGSKFTFTIPYHREGA